MRYEIIEWTYGRKVNFNCLIQYKKNFYSVPYQYVGKSVDVKAGIETLSIFYKGKRIATHPLFPDNVQYKYST
ncbi:MAG: Mu transposase domain-containing protein [Intestinibaculum porci]|uniref:Mu transposase domain-containing protein n=1 Tax=Intestinibaculum porci TaxID=2487118 RepID=UPI003EFFD3CC